MSYIRYVLMIMYDLSTEDKINQKIYRQIFSYLKKSGFYQMQESIYLKPLLQKEKAKQYTDKIASLSKQGGHIRSLLLTYESFLQMDCLSGEDSKAERLIRNPASIIVI